jgi:hypothetical protein
MSQVGSYALDRVPTETGVIGLHNQWIMDACNTEIQSINKSETRETMLKLVSEHRMSEKFKEWFGEYQTCPNSSQRIKLRYAQKLTVRYRQGPS